MNKKIIGSVILCIILVSCVIIARNMRKPKGLLADNDTASISNVVLHCSYAYITVTEQEDIKRIVDLLQSIKAEESRPSGKDGGMPLEIHFQNGEELGFGFLSEEITADGVCYRPDRDYCNDISNFYEEFSKKYTEEPA
ncbi:MAG: hypothetical protein HFH14_05620 [Lachnospiraceae bacterium]|nr:hypothetical protein [Lachnospiraceae bacterium]